MKISNHCKNDHVTKTVLQALIGSALFFSCSTAFAVFNGVNEESLNIAEQHRYAGFFYYQSQSHSNANVTCGVTLVDGPDIRQEFKRRVVLTARHCLPEEGDEQTVHVTFDNTPGMVMGNGDRFPTAFNINEPIYDGKAYSLPLDGIWWNQDFGIIILDKAVGSEVPAKIASLPSLGLAESAFKKDIIMSGYGTIVWGNAQSTKLDPNVYNDAGATGSGNIKGDREKMTISMPVLSVTQGLILTQMRYSQGEGTACNGDSGSGIITSDSFPGTILGVVSGGDFSCRALNTAARVDTQAFKDHLIHVQDIYPGQ